MFNQIFKAMEELERQQKFAEAEQVFIEAEEAFYDALPNEGMDFTPDNLLPYMEQLKVMGDAAEATWKLAPEHLQQQKDDFIVAVVEGNKDKTLHEFVEGLGNDVMIMVLTMDDQMIRPQLAALYIILRDKMVTYQQDLIKATK